MRGFVVLFLCAVAVVESIHTEEIEINDCEETECAQRCHPAKQSSMFNLKFQDDLQCYCPCGSQKSEPCQENIDCVFGLHCAAGDERGGHGKCEDACKMPGFSCGLFDKCHIDASGNPECVCKLWQCSDIQIGHGVCAHDILQNRQRTFHNDCLFVNEDCERRMRGVLGLTKLHIDECAELIPFTDATTLAMVGIGK